jgi:hypothetical protein
MGDRKPNLEAARKSARVILRGVRAGRGPRAYRYDVFTQVTDSRFDPQAAKATAEVIKAARAGDSDARAALHDAIAWMIREKEQLPDPLRDYLLELLSVDTGPRKRGPQPHQHHLRDGLIAHAVRAVMDHGYDHRRNRATKTPSACSIVAEVLAEMGVHMTEKNVEKVSRPRPRAT